MLASMRKLSTSQLALAIFAIAFATIAGAWIFEYFGYAPCELCLMQRWAYYAGVPIAALTAILAASNSRPMLPILFGLLALIFAGSAIFGVYHSGVEWGFWPGPAGCTGTTMPRAGNMQDFMKQLQTVRVVRCDEVAIRIFGLSLAGWNAVISAAVVVIALWGFNNSKRIELGNRTP